MMNPEQVGYDAVQLQAFHRDVRDRVSGLPRHRRSKLGFQHALLVESASRGCLD